MLKPSLCAAAAIGLFFASSALIKPAVADPPPWARAEGWREHHDRDDDEWRDRDWREHHEEERWRDHHDRDDDDDRPVVVVAPQSAPPPPPMPYGLDQNVCNRDLIGAALGGAAGGLIGSNMGKGKGRTAATVGGVLVGLFVGGSIGRRMDQLDQSCAGEALEHVPDGQTVVWQGQNQQDGYWVTPVKTYQEGDGRYCREYQSDAVIAGRPQHTYGTACRQPDGSWQIVK